MPNLYAPSHVLPSELQPDLRSLQLDTEPLPADLTAYDLITDGDMEQLSLEIEKERSKQWQCLLETTHFLSSYFTYLSWHDTIVPYILESNPYPNLIRTRFCRFLKRKIVSSLF